SIRNEVLAAVGRGGDSQNYILGAGDTSLGREFAALCTTAAAGACKSGTDALWLGLNAARPKSGGAGVPTAFKFFATASSIVRAGARPVFADIDPETLNLDPARVEAGLKASSARRSGIMPVHLYGQVADMTALGRIAAEFKLPIIEDAAQAVGA